MTLVMVAILEARNATAVLVPLRFASGPAGGSTPAGYGQILPKAPPVIV
jgi:hypothetical protein